MIKDIDYKINWLFVPLNFILKRFNYIISFNFTYVFDSKKFESNIYKSCFSLKKIQKTDSKIFYRIIKEYVIWEKYYDNNK